MALPDHYILMIGCFDTKGEVFSYLHDCIKEKGEKVLAVNTGIMGTTDLFPVDIEETKVASEAGVSITDLRKKGDRGYAVNIMGIGAAKVVAKLVSEGNLKAAISMGGGGGTYIALSAMQKIPFGIPKLCLSTIAAKDLTRQMGIKDILLMPSVVDVAGLNSISKKLIKQAAAAICAMANENPDMDETPAGKIAISMFGNTTACVDMCSKILYNEGFEVYAFHATGVGGKTMESLIREGCFDAVLDITTTELADELCNGIMSAGPDRLCAAAEMGIPQVVVPGCLDMVNFAQVDTVPVHYQHRELYQWAPDVTLMRTDEAENRNLGEILAKKVNKSTGPTVILLPLKGVSQISAAGGVFHQPETDQILFNTIKSNAEDPVQVLDIDAHINDPVFAEVAVKTLLKMIENRKVPKDKSQINII